jgi:hypothetical protein
MLRTDTRSVGMIDTYVAELAGALSGPRRAKADLIAETRDSLVDATKAYRRRGLDREAAEHRAVTEFGDVAEIAPAYQTELGLAQGQRTAFWIVCVLAPQSLVWDHVGGLVLGDSRWDPTPGYAVVDNVLPWLGLVAITSSLLAGLACGIGTRYLRVARELTRATGVLAFVVSAVFAISGALLTVLSPAPVTTGLLLLAAIVLLPLLCITVSAQRCLAAA